MQSATIFWGQVGEVHASSPHPTQRNVEPLQDVKFI